MYEDFESTHFGLDHVNGVKNFKETLDKAYKELDDMVEVVKGFLEAADLSDSGLCVLYFLM